jgi:PAS domain-containing protein
LSPFRRPCPDEFEETHVSWATMKRWWAIAANRRRASQDGLADDAPPADTSIEAAEEAAKVEECVTEHAAKNTHARSPRHRSVRTSERTRVWRRRALLRKGARLYSHITGQSGFVSLAMLDEDGIVIAWFERARERSGSGERPLIQGHVSQLYMPEDIALGIPVRDLCSATVHGHCTGSGWRRGSDGAKFWATVIIKPILLRDGRLQGFSHTTHRASAPWSGDRNTHQWSWKWFAESKTSRRPALGSISNAS